MTESKEKDDAGKKTLSLKGGTLGLKAGAAAGRPQTARGAIVEVRRNRAARPTENEAPVNSELQNLTSEERDARAKALKEALAESDRKKPMYQQPVGGKVTRAAPISTESKEDEARRRELDELQRIEADEKRKTAALEKQGQDTFRAMPIKTTGEEESTYRDRMKRSPKAPRSADDETSGGGRRTGKLTVTQVLNEQYEREREMSLAARRRAQDKARKAAMGPQVSAQKVFREVTVPETITVQELANRMTERSGDVIKALMKLGIMATINDVIDADTAELVVGEFGHTIKRVTDADVEVNVSNIEERTEDLKSRPPVVTIMGHVDHGKTSLLDALRKTDVVSGEAGGITQHIGAYQVQLPSGAKITFLDTPGHAAFTEMRARGANVTDIVVLVVAANDGIMPQTVEAINHAKAAKVPMIVAINKIDLPDANPKKVKEALLQYEIVVEDLGGETQTVEISAKKKLGLDKLEECILLQAEILELKANPSRPAVGAVVEAKMETGRGSVATILVQQGTLKIGDIFAVGAEWGRVRAIYDDKGQQVKTAEPGKPVEVLGLQGTPDSGDVLNVVETEAKARELASYRARKKREKMNVTTAKGGGMTLDDMLAAAREAGAKQTLPVVIKGDVHGSVEAIIGSLNKMTEENPEVAIQVLHSGVGAITESDVTLAKASNAMIVGFNVRANAQARVQAERDGVNIRYYNIIYNVIDDAKAVLSGMLSPSKREEYLGHASVRQVFNITKVGKIGGCMVTAGVVKRGAKVRLLRDNVVIHEGMLKTLKRFKDEVKEVKEGMECGMAFENYDDLKENDVIECFEIVEEARTLT